MELKCPNESCSHTWNYTGKKAAPAWVACPNCLHRVRLPEEENMRLAGIIERIASIHSIDLRCIEADLDDDVSEYVCIYVDYEPSSITEKCIIQHLDAIICSPLLNTYPGTVEGENAFIQKMDVVREMDEDDFSDVWSDVIPQCSIYQVVEELLTKHLDNVYYDEDTIDVECMEQHNGNEV